MHEVSFGKQEKTFSRLLGGLYSFTRSKGFAQGLVIIIGSLMCMLIFILTVTPKRYSLYVGMVPNQTISANKDVVDELTTLKNREIAAEAVTPIYHYREGVAEEVLSNLEAVYSQMLGARQYAQSLPDYGDSRVYTQQELQAAHEYMNLVKLQDFQLTTLLNASTEQFDELFAALRPAIRNTMQGNITQGQEAIAITGIMQVVGFKTSVSLLQNVALPLLRATVRPNMVVDEEATQAARLSAWEAVEPTIFKQGQNIVVAGEGRIKENQIAMLTSLGLLSDNQVDYAMYIGSFILVTCVLTLAALFLRFFCLALFNNLKRLLIVYLTMVLTLALCLFAKEIRLMYLAPLALPYMLLTVTVGILPGAIAGLSTSLIAALMLTNAGSASMDMINLIMMAVFSGTFSALLLHRKYQRSLILITGAAAGLSGFLIILSIGLMTSMSLSATLNKALWVMLGGAANALLCLSLQPAIESLFNLPTPMRLLDLTNPNHPLMRRLLLEAPGTFHHSIIIANLAEAAAEAIGANPLLARAGAYFHDIGKLKRPLYFKENQIGISNLHDSTDPQVSAAIIISHVREGIALARQHRLPQEIQQIIAEHHGNSLVAFFYNKALSEADGKPVDDKAFRYDGVPPQTAEGALIMLCDTVEAAIRTLSNPTREEITSFIDELIRKKVETGMFNQSPLTLKDLSLVRDSCASVIYGVFHERIEYPSDPNKLPPAERVLAYLQSIRRPARPAAQSLPPQSPVIKPLTATEEVLQNAPRVTDKKAAVDTARQSLSSIKAKTEAQKGKA